MKKNKVLIIKRLFLLLAIFTFFKCSEEEKIKNCGCDSNTTYTIPDAKLTVPIEEQTTGLLFFKRSDNIDGFYDDEEYNNRYWIVQGNSDCYNCQRKFIICNEAILGSEYQYLKNEENKDSIEVEFSGETKLLCISKIILADYDYKEIVLTSIKSK